MKLRELHIGKMRKQSTQTSASFAEILNVLLFQCGEPMLGDWFWLAQYLRHQTSCCLLHIGRTFDENQGLSSVQQSLISWVVLAVDVSICAKWSHIFQIFSHSYCIMDQLSTIICSLRVCRRKREEKKEEMKVKMERHKKMEKWTRNQCVW